MAEFVDLVLSEHFFFDSRTRLTVPDFAVDWYRFALRRGNSVVFGCSHDGRHKTLGRHVQTRIQNEVADLAVFF